MSWNTKMLILMLSDAVQGVLYIREYAESSISSTSTLCCAVCLVAVPVTVQSHDITVTDYTSSRFRVDLLYLLYIEYTLS